jgi:hypothetical protein
MIARDAARYFVAAAAGCSCEYLAFVSATMVRTIAKRTIAPMIRPMNAAFASVPCG